MAKKLEENISDLIDVKIVLALMSGKMTSAINRKFSKELHQANLEVSPAQTTVLFALWYQDGVTQKTVADETYKDKPSITRLLDNMEKNGLIERRRDAEDRRINKIFLSQKGQDMEGPVIEAAKVALSQGFKGLTEQEAKDVQRLLKKVFENLETRKGAEKKEEDY